MEKTDGTWKLFVMYFAIILLILLSNSAFGQITATHFNAGWNQSNDVSWFMGLKDCGTKGLTDISKDTEAAKKYKIAVVPTIIIFKDGEEALRFQADLSFKMASTKEEVQEAIDELLMSDF
tara:strand:- start:271 stop:633 length:363 start_codon:yes stop_codon:yes gene_type:complete